MCPAIKNPASYEFGAIVIRFLRDKIMTAAVIHREFCAVYGQNLMSEGIVRQWLQCSKIREQIFTMKSEVVGDL
jgi:hypothetical protein